MSANEVSLVLKHVKKFPNSVLNVLSSKEPQDAIGGIIKKGELGWIATGSHLEVVSLKTGNRVASYTFDNAAQISNTVITCLTEFDFPVTNSCILAVGVQFPQTGGMICIFSIQGSRILRCIEIKEKITSCCFVPETVCQRSIFKLFDGCLAIGSENGNILMIDLCFKNCSDIWFERMINRCELELIESRIFLASTNFKAIRQEYKNLKKDGFNIGMQLDHLEEIGIESPVLSILVLSPLMTLTFGLDDGRMILYNLMDLQPYHLAHPPEVNSPLIKLAYLEPADDPRACVYIWAFHGSLRGSIAVMHSVMFEKKLIDESFALYDNFQACTVRCTMPFFDCDSRPISCQAITKKSTNEEYDICLIQFGWGSAKKDSNIIIFDLNQWYKEQMPNISDWRSRPSYLVSFQLNTGLSHDIWINEKSVDPFNSIQRPEEHFYPNSLSFDCLVLSTESCILKHWPGLQNKVLDLLESSGPSAILEPDRYINEVLSAALMPQFGDYNFGSNFSLNSKRDFLLSIALEYNSVGLLKECAKVWADGSHLGQQPFEGLSLSTLTEWIWKQSNDIKECCKTMSQPLFNNSRNQIDNRSKKTLSHCARQLQLLSDLLEMVLSSCKANIPLDVYKKLKTQQNNIKMSSEYQEVLQWLLNIGLIPEFEWKSISGTNDEIDVYQDLRYDYMEKRNIYFKADKNNVDPTSCSCKILYIDSFIEQECGGEVLRKLWKDGWTDGLYPPRSLESMLKVMLLPDVCIENKYMLLVYFFLDLNYMAQCDERFSDVVKNLIKFPAVFKLNPALIKTTQAFWNLDRERFEVALEELISPLSQNRQLSKWQQEFLIESLIAQNVPNFALRALRALGSHIPAQLEMKTFLANNLIAEALQLQRSKGDNNLLRDFFKYCFTHEKWKYLFNLALSEEEDSILTELLNSSDLVLAENFQFLYLLQRSKYIEAISHVNNLHKRNDGFQRDFANKGLLLSAYDSTVTPVVGNLSGFYLRFHDKFKNTKQTSFTKPLSSKLIQDRTNVVGGIYQRAFMSTEAVSWDDEPQPRNDCLYKNDIPFLRKPVLDRYTKPVQRSQVIFPKVIDSTTKRSSEIRLSSEMEGPRKRVKLDNEHSLLSRKSIHDLNSSNLTSFKAKSHRDVMEFLDKTLEGRNKKDDKMSTPIQGRKPEQLSTPQSILKVTNIFKDVSTTSVTTRRSCSPFLVSARKSIEPEEKSIRFIFTESQNCSIESARKSPSFLGATIRDSIRSSDNSIVSSSVDEFFSPIGSTNTSMIVEQPEIKIIVTPPKEDERNAPSTSKDPRFHYKMPLSRLVLESNAKKSILIDESMEVEADSSFNDSDVEAILLQRQKILSENSADSESLLRCKWNSTMETTSTSEASPSFAQTTIADESSIRHEESESSESSESDDEEKNDATVQAIEESESDDDEIELVQVENDSEFDDDDDAIDAEILANEAEIQANQAEIQAIEAEIHARELLLNDNSVDSNDEIEAIENEIEDIVGEIEDMEDEMNDTDDEDRIDSDYASHGSGHPSPEVIEIGSSDESSSIFSHSSTSLDVPQVGDESSSSSSSESVEEEEVEVIQSEAEDEMPASSSNNLNMARVNDSSLDSESSLNNTSVSDLNKGIVIDQTIQNVTESISDNSVLNRAVWMESTSTASFSQNLLPIEILDESVMIINSTTLENVVSSTNEYEEEEMIAEAMKVIEDVEVTSSSTGEIVDLGESVILLSDEVLVVPGPSNVVEEAEEVSQRRSDANEAGKEAIEHIIEIVLEEEASKSDEKVEETENEAENLIIQKEATEAVVIENEATEVEKEPEILILEKEKMKQQENEAENLSMEKEAEKQVQVTEDVVMENEAETLTLEKEAVKQQEMLENEAENLSMEKEAVKQIEDVDMGNEGKNDENEAENLSMEKEAVEHIIDIVMEQSNNEKEAENVIIEKEAENVEEAEDVVMETEPKNLIMEKEEENLIIEKEAVKQQERTEEAIMEIEPENLIIEKEAENPTKQQEKSGNVVMESEAENLIMIKEAVEHIIEVVLEKEPSIDNLVIEKEANEAETLKNQEEAETSLEKEHFIEKLDLTSVPKDFEPVASTSKQPEVPSTPQRVTSRRLSQRISNSATKRQSDEEDIRLHISESESENEQEKIGTPSRVLRKTRARSIDMKPTALDSPSVNKSIRATSMSKLNVEEPTTPSRRSKRTASTDTPTRVLRGRLDKIDEDDATPATPKRTKKPSVSEEVDSVDLPARRLRSNSTTEVVTPVIPSTPTRRTRKNSENSDAPKSRGRKRLTSVNEEEVDFDDNKSDKSSVRSSRILRSQHLTIPEEEDADGSMKSSASATSRLGRTPKRVRTPQSSVEVSPAEAIDYSATRRLTRHQLAAMENAAKKIEAHKKLPQQKKKSPKQGNEEDEDEADDSDAESVVSKVSKQSKVSNASKARSVRSKKGKPVPEKDADTVSVASSSKSKRGRPKKILTPTKADLAVIEEDSESDNSVGEEPIKKRGRSKKN